MFKRYWERGDPLKGADRSWLGRKTDFFLVSTALLVIALIGLGPTPLPPVQAAPGSLSAEQLSRLEQENPPRLFRKLFRLEDRDELVIAMDWLKPRVLKAKGPRYAYAYSLNLWRAGLKDSAVAIWLSGRVLAMVDGSKCKDPSGPAARIAQLDRLAAPVVRHYQKLKRKGDDLEKPKRIALEIERQYENPGANRWVCGGGMSHIKELIEENPGAVAEGQGTEKHIGEVKVLPKDSSVEPELIPESEWKKARAKAVSAFKEFIGRDSEIPDQKTGSEPASEERAGADAPDPGPEPSVKGQVSNEGAVPSDPRTPPQWGESSKPDLHLIGIQGPVDPKADQGPWWARCEGDTSNPEVGRECHQKMVRRKNKQLWPVQVTVETKEPVVLALMSHRNAHWKVRNKGKGPIKGVVLAGYGKQKVSGLPSQVPVQAYTYKDSPCGPCRESGKWFQAFRRGTEDYRKAVDRLKEITGLRPASFQGREEGKAFYVGGGSQAFGE